jgi:hypothetical protein
VLLDSVGSVEGFEQEILQVHGELSGRLGDVETAKQCRAQAQAEIERKAQFIHSEVDRRRFLEHADYVWAQLAAAQPPASQTPASIIAEEPDGA